MYLAYKIYQMFFKLSGNAPVKGAYLVLIEDTNRFPKRSPNPFVSRVYRPLRNDTKKCTKSADFLHKTSTKHTRKMHVFSINFVRNLYAFYTKFMRFSPKNRLKSRFFDCVCPGSPDPLQNKRSVPKSTPLKSS